VNDDDDDDDDDKSSIFDRCKSIDSKAFAKLMLSSLL
jgi:hypothetical protein